MRHKTFLGLYKKDDIIPLEIKFLVLVGLCTFYAFNGFLIIKAIILAVLLFFCILSGKKNFLKLAKAISISSLVLLFFWVVFVHKISVSTFLIDIIDTLKSSTYIRAIFRLFGLVIPGWLFMSMISEHELLSTLIRHKAKPEIIIFFIVTFNTIAHFISSYRTISLGYRMRVSKKQNVMTKLVYILTTLLFNCILLITKTKKVYYLYEDRINQTLLSEKNEFFQDKSKLYNYILEININNVSYENTRLLALEPV